MSTVDCPESQAAAGPARQAEPARAFVLEVIGGPDVGRTFTPAKPDGTTLGTDASCDLVLTDRTVSRRHCAIGNRDGHLRIRDLGSRNGTRIGGVMVLDAILQEGQAFTLGHTHIRARGAGPIQHLGRDHFGRLVGRSPSMRALYTLLERASASDATVMLVGETGTGKEAAAEAIHRASSRRHGPFVVVDCASIPPSLLASELFGHERGAFTGAHARREGAFESADGGTVFLDEIGELAPELQPALLRVLEERAVKRVGTSSYVPVDVRVISATHRDLTSEIAAQRFRADLYFRIAVLEVHLPPLRERAEDLPDLVDHFLSRLEAAAEESAELRSPELLALLARHPWPGNVRELRNYVDRFVALKGVPPPAVVAGAAERPASPTEVDAGRAAAPTSVQHIDRERMMFLLGRHGGHIGRAAAALGVHRRTLERRIKALGLR